MFADPELGHHHERRPHRPRGDPPPRPAPARLPRPEGHRRLDLRAGARRRSWSASATCAPRTELPGGVLECGWYLARAHWGSGLAEEAARAIVGHAHHTLGAPAVFALVHEDNPRGRRFTERLGFVDVGAGTHYGAVHRVLVSLPRPSGRAPRRAVGRRPRERRDVPRLAVHRARLARVPALAARRELAVRRVLRRRRGLAGPARRPARADPARPQPPRAARRETGPSWTASPRPRRSTAGG